MNSVSFHLLINHFALFAFPIALGLGFWGFYAKKKQLLLSCYVLSAVGFFTLLLAHVSGEAAYEHIAENEMLEEVRSYADAHAAIAHDFNALFLIGLALSALTLYFHFRPFKFSRKLFFLIAGLLVISIVVLSIIAHTGGEIRHPAVRW